MIAVYVTAAMFISWLLVMLYRVWRMLSYRGAGTVALGNNSEAVPHRLEVLVQDQADGLEGFVHRLATALQCRTGMVTLVDGGSADETGVILERLARRYNMECHRLVGDKSCLAGTTGPGIVHGPVHRLDLRGLSNEDLVKFDLTCLKSGCRGEV
ncbi:hypothetical protein [Desulfoscipio gibsoniae]|uniref:Glycosyl transferase n=1 Tax=Desulfoscipio gibsoniae DSM 7213 TaxID=767817 RepID=R4KVE9_9FIRM|nr:hypothetical protein [Desulfoscipio gibsoniae]AGL03586.1 hypothetical protein Desgi_4343 [Desulfoscipio gibsoniae DSM 7213]